MFPVCITLLFICAKLILQVESSRATLSLLPTSPKYKGPTILERASYNLQISSVGLELSFFTFVFFHKG